LTPDWSFWRRRLLSDQEPDIKSQAWRLFAGTVKFPIRRRNANPLTILTIGPRANYAGSCENPWCVEMSGRNLRCYDPHMTPVHAVIDVACRNCQPCRQYFYHRWHERSVEEMTRANRCLLNTLTFAEAVNTAKAYAEVRHYMRRVRRTYERAARRQGKPVPRLRYLLVIQRGERGEKRVHVHMVVCISGAFLADPRPGHAQRGRQELAEAIKWRMTRTEKEKRLKPEDVGQWTADNARHFTAEAVAEREWFNNHSLEYPTGRWEAGFAKILPVIDNIEQAAGYVLRYCLRDAVKADGAETLPGGRKLSASTFWGPGVPRSPADTAPIDWPVPEARTQSLREWLAAALGLGADTGSAANVAPASAGEAPSGGAEVGGPTCAWDIKSSHAKGARGPPLDPQLRDLATSFGGIGQARLVTADDFYRKRAELWDGWTIRTDTQCPT
jgi:hypothetical protein